MMRNKKWIAFPFIAAAILAAAGGIVMLLWNCILPAVTDVKPLSYWQSVGLLALCRILFGQFGAGRGRRHHIMRERMMGRTPSPEDRERLKELWRERCRRFKGQEGQE
jgi:hypothetical protein